MSVLVPPGLVGLLLREAFGEEEARPLQVGAEEVRPLQVGEAEVRLLQVGVAEARPLQVGADEVHPRYSPSLREPTEHSHGGLNIREDAKAGDAGRRVSGRRRIVFHAQRR